MEDVFRIERVGDVTVLSTCESLEANTSPKLTTFIKKLALETGLMLVIDMHEVQSMDSTGCGALVASLRTLRANEGELKIARANEKILALLKLTRLHRVFEIYEELNEATKSFSGLPMKPSRF